MIFKQSKLQSLLSFHEHVYCSSEEAFRQVLPCVYNHWDSEKWEHIFEGFLWLNHRKNTKPWIFGQIFQYLDPLCVESAFFFHYFFGNSQRRISPLSSHSLFICKTTEHLFRSQWSRLQNQPLSSALSLVLRLLNSRPVESRCVGTCTIYRRDLPQ